MGDNISGVKFKKKTVKSGLLRRFGASANRKKNNYGYDCTTMGQPETGMKTTSK